MRTKVEPVSQLEVFTGPRVEISIFEGPLDLLLHLVRRQEVDVYELKIAEITGEYLRMLGTMSDLNIEVSGEFLVLASTLCLIKSRLLLPASEAEVVEEEVDEAEDPQRELTQRLAEYRVFKEAAEALQEAHSLRQRIYLRAEGLDPELHSGPILLEQVSVFDLVAVFQDLLSRASGPPTAQLLREAVTVRDRIRHIVGVLSQAPNETLTFHELVTFPTTRLVVIMTFLAVLELIRRRRLLVHQDRVGGEIRVRLLPPPPPEPI